MKQVIDVSAEVREGIRRAFKVSTPSIWNALTFDEKRGQSDRAKRIRQYAKLNGGVEMMVAEKSDTLLFDADGCFRQYFVNGAVLEFDKQTGSASLYYKGERMMYLHNVLVREMEPLQRVASNWTEDTTEAQKERNLLKERMNRQS